MNEPISDPGFAPSDLTDGRKPGDWKTRYPEKEAQNAIRLEGIYIATLLFASPIVLLILWFVKLDEFLPFSEVKCEVFCRYAYAWFAGLLGGTLHVMKYLYHSVAHWTWNRDRRLWRLLAPHLSAALAFATICMINSGILLIFEQESTRKPSVIVSLAFLVGYFSDNALAKMSEVAISLFGIVRKN